MGKRKQKGFLGRRQGVACGKRRAMTVLFACAFFSILFSGCQEDRALTLTLSKEASEAGQPAKGDGDASVGSSLEADPGSNGEEGIYVHVCGAVKAPGIVFLPAGSRAFDALERAEGFTEDADQSYVNLAGFLSDGQQLYFPTREEVLSGERVSDDRVNLNAADEETLKTLPGIGQSRAKAILKYRKENGVFARAEDLMLVPGITETLWEQIKELVMVK